MATKKKKTEKEFNDSEWQAINAIFNKSADDFGLPERRDDSVVIGSFNIRKLGAIKARPDRYWDFLKSIIERFDLIAIQEIMDDLSGLEYLKELLGKNYGMVVSDVTGVKPGERGNPERLGFLFNWKRIERTALASDITYDRSDIANNLYNHRAIFDAAWEKHKEKLDKWEIKCKKKKAEGKKKPGKPPMVLPKFLSFIRQPHYVSFQTKVKKKTVDPLKFLVVNAHLHYGTKKEREMEFYALLDWLTVRAQEIDKLYHPNILLLSDCNLDFGKVSVMRNKATAFIKSLNKSVLDKKTNKKAATANFPILSPHPKHGILKTNLRQKETYDQIGIFSHDTRLPTPDDNKNAGTTDGDYDYGVFNIANLLAMALHGKNLNKVTANQRKAIYKKSEWDISDHMPIWIRLKLPE